MYVRDVLILLLILLASLWLRLWRLGEITTPYFDEQYHVPAIVAMSRGNWTQVFDYRDPVAQTWDWLHPPLAKYLAAWSVAVLGEHPAAWRLSSAIAGVLVLVVFYFFLRDLGRQWWQLRSVALVRSLALGGTVLLASSGLLLVQSRIAMNDIWLTLWLLLAVWSWLHWWKQPRALLRLLLAGALLGLAVATKWTAWLLLGWLLVLTVAKRVSKRWQWRTLPFRLFSLLLLPAAIYVLSYWPLLWQPAGLSRFLELQQVIWQSQLHNPSSHPESSRPWSWPLGGQAVRYFADADRELYLFENPWLLTYTGLLLAGMAVALTRQRWRARLAAVLQWGQPRPRQATFILLSCYLVTFLPFLFFSRIMFLYHYLPSLPFVLAVTMYVWQRLFARAPQALHFNFYFWPVWFLLLAYPLWTALQLYF